MNQIIGDEGVKKVEGKGLFKNLGIGVVFESAWNLYTMNKS